MEKIKNVNPVSEEEIRENLNFENKYLKEALHIIRDGLLNDKKKQKCVKGEGFFGIFIKDGFGSTIGFGDVNEKQVAKIVTSLQQISDNLIENTIKDNPKLQKINKALEKAFKESGLDIEFGGFQFGMPEELMAQDNCDCEACQERRKKKKEDVDYIG